MGLSFETFKYIEKMCLTNKNMELINKADARHFSKSCYTDDTLNLLNKFKLQKHRRFCSLVFCSLMRQCASLMTF